MMYVLTLQDMLWKRGVSRVSPFILTAHKKMLRMHEEQNRVRKQQEQQYSRTNGSMVVWKGDCKSELVTG